MSTAPSQRRGYCPNLWTAMESGDGLLVRVRPSRMGRGISAATLQALITLARAHGNGLLEITRRARLQLRGVRPESLASLQQAVVRLGLAEAQPERERRLALIVHPLAGLGAAFSTLPDLASELEAALVENPACDVLSDKFGVVLDSGGALRDIAADIHLDVRAHVPERVEISVASAGGWLPFGVSAIREVPPIVSALANALAQRECRRMREWIASSGVDALRDHVANSIPQAVQMPEQADQPVPLHAASRWIGSDREWLGFGVAFGSAEPEAWNALVALAARFGASEVRFTHARGVILPGIADADRERARDAARDAGFIVNPDDPLLRAAACPGAPACQSAHGETRALARSLAPLLAATESLHVSGCDKGCAHSGAASVTLVRSAHGCRLGFRQTSAETAKNRLVTLDAARVVLSGPRALAREPENRQARDPGTARSPHD